MNAAPVIVRELRAESRNPVNYFIRLLGAALVTGIFFLGAWADSDSITGNEIFAILSVMIFFGLWIFVPLMTADCISRERREGTLGLLFLTPLTSSGIVLGKGVIHCLRATVLLIATVPILTIPFLRAVP